MTARQLLAALRREVPEVAWDPLRTGIHWGAGRETITGQHGATVVVVDGADSLVEVTTEWRIQSPRAMRPQGGSFCIIGNSTEAAQVVRRAIAAVGAAIDAAGGLQVPTIQPPPSSKREGPKGLTMVPPPRG